MAVKGNNNFAGLVCIITGVGIIVFFLGTLLLRIGAGLAALSLIDHGLRLRGLPSLQMLITMFVQRRRFF
jgi:hypothetical protein